MTSDSFSDNDNGSHKDNYSATVTDDGCERDNCNDNDRYSDSDNYNDIMAVIVTIKIEHYRACCDNNLARRCLVIMVLVVIT